MIGTLYTFRRCPYAIRARLILKLANLEYQAVEVSLKDKPKDLLDYSPKGTVPVLVLNSGQVIDESLDIIDWVIKHHQSAKWKEGESEVGKALVSGLTQEFIPALNRYKYASRYQDVNVEQEAQKIQQYLEKLEERVNSVDMRSQVAIVPFVRQANIANSDWLQSPNLSKVNKWFISWLDSPEFIHVMKKI